MQIHIYVYIGIYKSKCVFGKHTLYVFKNIFRMKIKKSSQRILFWDCFSENHCL